jgi:hypothetical protein
MKNETYYEILYETAKATILLNVGSEAFLFYRYFLLILRVFIFQLLIIFKPMTAAEGRLRP